MREQFFRNPIIKGGYPDPSICRAGNYYYIVASSFSYFPGLPIFRSEDLVHWEQIGNAVSKKEQLDFQGCEGSEGLWAATIRYNDGIFYIVNTLSIKGKDKYNYIITAKDPEGEWSDAVWIKGADGIDPSLFFDSEGRMWYCSNALPKKCEYPEHKIIYICELDKNTFQIIGQKHRIFDAATDRTLYTEAPHIYEIDGRFYLMTASGGTQTNHCVNMYVSNQLLGSYTPCPRNPIITNRNVKLNNALGVAVTGHGDLVCTQNNEWYMVLLGIRPYKKYIENYDVFLPRDWIRKPDRNKDAQFNLGREVFLVPITWDYDGWPIADNENGMVNLIEKKPNLPEKRPPFKSRIDNFEDIKLDMIWCMRGIGKNDIFSLSARPGFLRLYLFPVSSGNGEIPSMILRRQQHNDFFASLSMEFTPISDGDEAGLVLTQNKQYSLMLIRHKENGQDKLSCMSIVNGKRNTLVSESVSGKKVYLHVEGAAGKYSFFYGFNERQMIQFLTDADGTILSTTVADGFVGTYVGLYASCENTKLTGSRYADFDWFKYEIIDD